MDGKEAGEKEVEATTQQSTRLCCAACLKQMVSAPGVSRAPSRMEPTNSRVLGREQQMAFQGKWLWAWAWAKDGERLDEGCSFGHPAVDGGSHISLDVSQLLSSNVDAAAVTRVEEASQLRRARVQKQRCLRLLPVSA